MQIIKTNLLEFDRFVCDFLSSKINQLISKNNNINIALSGGLTPLSILSLMSNENISWNLINFYQVDERVVPKEDERSNARNLKKYFLNKVNSNFFQIYDEEIELKSCVEKYNKLIEQNLAQENSIPVFDIILLGMGMDGHIASLFPGSKALSEKSKYYVINHVQELNEYRITATFPLIKNSKNIFLIIRGKKKIDYLNNYNKIKNKPVFEIIKLKKKTVVLCAE